MVEKTEHVDEANDEIRSIFYDLSQSTLPTITLLHNQMPKYHHILRSTESILIVSEMICQFSPETTTIMKYPTRGNCGESKGNYDVKQRNTGLPKGILHSLRAYGDGVPIVFNSSNTTFRKVEQRRNLTTTSASPSDRNSSELNLIKLDNNKFTNLYTSMYDIRLLTEAYYTIKSKHGNMTPGVESETLDGISYKFIDKLSESIKDCTYKFKPSRRVEIPKANGQMRRISVASPIDQIVQQAMYMLLNAIYEPKFQNSSHGFRPNRSCHTALKEIGKWTGIMWAIEGDIASYFDSINKHKLAHILSESIEDKRFIDLIWKFCNAGYLKDSIIHNDNTGVPQVGVVSTILSNIYLDKLDTFVDKLIKENTKLPISKNCPKYRKVYYALEDALRKYKKTEDKTFLKEEVKKTLKNMPSMVRIGTRVTYIRYADDWIIGVIGDKQLAIELKNQIKSFLKTELDLELSEEKTKITHLRTEKARFLGTDIFTASWSASIKDLTRKKVNKKKVTLQIGKSFSYKLRTAQTRIGFRAPMLDILKKLAQKGFIKNYNPDKKLYGEASYIGKWVFLDHKEIILRYNAVIRGLLNYYSFVDNKYSMNSLIKLFLRPSCAKTLARKFNLNSRAQVFKKFGPLLSFKDGKETTSLHIPSTFTRTRSFNDKNICEPSII